jgi:2-methylisocitrate lyase-like PEP mutase family enzyme
MNKTEQSERAESFRRMHHGPRVLLLPNVWDVASARIVENAGFTALATTSAGIAFSLGYPDGQKISREEMLAQVARIARAVDVPVSADVEAGYGNSPEDAAKTALGVIEAGAVGMNLEDRMENGQVLVDLSLQLEKIAAIRETAASAGISLVLNARTDVLLAHVGEESRRYDLALARLAAFRDARANCVFAPGLRDPETIRRLVADLRCPLNILAVPGSPTVGELEQLGVARVSLGSGPMRATLGLLRAIAAELKATGTYRAIENAPSHTDVNRLMTTDSVRL